MMRIRDYFKEVYKDDQNEAINARQMAWLLASSTLIVGVFIGMFHVLVALAEGI